MGIAEQEWATRGIPWTEGELGWQRNRPAEHRVPLPRVGDGVRFRFRRFEMNPAPALVVEVPDLERDWRWTDLEPGADTPDGWTWQLIRHNWTGEPILDAAGLPVVRLLPDPQPVIGCRVEGVPGVQYTREARLRGSPGWLPLDWRDRWRPSPMPGKAAWNLTGPPSAVPSVLPDGQMIVPGA